MNTVKWNVGLLSSDRTQWLWNTAIDLNSTVPELYHVPWHDEALLTSACHISHLCFPVGFSQHHQLPTHHHTPTLCFELPVADCWTGHHFDYLRACLEVAMPTVCFRHHVEISDQLLLSFHALAVVTLLPNRDSQLNLSAKHQQTSYTLKVSKITCQQNTLNCTASASGWKHIHVFNAACMQHKTN